MRLIDADAFKAAMWHKWDHGHFGDDEWIYFSAMIDDAPTVEPPRIKGKWIDGGDEEYGAFKYHVWRCSECGDEVVENGKPQENFCAMCGADMRETE